MRQPSVKFVALVILCFVAFGGINGLTQDSTWTWTDGDGKVRTKAELDVILAKHILWDETNAAQGIRANFIGADLTECNLQGVNLSRAYMSQVILSGAHLERAKLRGAQLSGAFFLDTDLSDADLSETNLSDASLITARLVHADLSKANLTKAVLKNANLTSADLGGANLQEANLSGARLEFAYLDGADLAKADFTLADLDGADLSSSNYEPRLPPPVENIYGSDGLSELKFAHSRNAIVSLRKSLHENGFVSEAREVNASIHRHDESPMEKWLFDWTCEWGSNWIRPLLLLGLVCLLTTPLYWIGMHTGSRRTGLFLTTVLAAGSRERLHRISGDHNRWFSQNKQRNIEPKSPWWRIIIWRVWDGSLAEISRFRIAFFFSMMTVFNIGFHDFNFGRWIRMLQPREYDIRARGWMRTVAGLQSLLGLLLIALSLLSYFGHPFD